MIFIFQSQLRIGYERGMVRPRTKVMEFSHGRLWEHMLSWRLSKGDAGVFQQIFKARYGYSRDHRFDCQQVVIALVITPEEFPLAYEVLEGNTAAPAIPTEDVLATMRRQQEISYLVGNPRSKIQQYASGWISRGRGCASLSRWSCSPGRRTLCAGQKRWKAGQGASHWAQTLARLLWNLHAMRLHTFHMENGQLKQAELRDALSAVFQPWSRRIPRCSGSATSS